MSVFINCPFDKDYLPIFDSVVFATVCCGFLPRCAIESGCTAVPRMDRITQAILSSKYSIHDLCRCKGEGDANLARFNMPLELGVSMAQRFGPDGVQAHDWLLLVPKGSEYVRFVSDLAGFDPKQHDGTLSTVVPAVMSWLATRPDAIKVPTPRAVLGAPRLRRDPLALARAPAAASRAPLRRPLRGRRLGVRGARGAPAGGAHVRVGHALGVHALAPRPSRRRAEHGARGCPVAVPGPGVGDPPSALAARGRASLPRARADGRRPVPWFPMAPQRALLDASPGARVRDPRMARHEERRRRHGQRRSRGLPARDRAKHPHR